MGSLISSLLGEDSAKEVREQLELLQEMGSNIMTAESEKMRAKAFEDKILPIVAVVDTQTLCRIGVESNESLSEDIGKIVGDFVKGKYTNGITDIIHTLLSNLLGGATAGRQESRQFHVAFGSNALLRIDVYFYMYTFESQSLLRNHGSNMLCCVSQIAVLDSMNTNPQVVLYEVTKAIGEDKVEEALKDLEKDTAFAESLYEHIRRLKKSSEQEAE